MKLTIDGFYSSALTEDQRNEIRAWASQYTDISDVYEFDIAMDGPTQAARFHHLVIMDIGGEWHQKTVTTDAFNTEPCPWPYREESAA